jgi:hypothetical protein
METLIVVLVVLAALAAVLTGVAFYRGWFQLASLPAEEKVKFVLMNKSDKSRENERNTAMSPKDAGPQAPANVVPPSPPSANPPSQNR